jgi:hypothetical protein
LIIAFPPDIPSDYDSLTLISCTSVTALEIGHFTLRNDPTSPEKPITLLERVFTLFPPASSVTEVVLSFDIVKPGVDGCLWNLRNFLFLEAIAKLQGRFTKLRRVLLRFLSPREEKVLVRDVRDLISATRSKDSIGVKVEVEAVNTKYAVFMVSAPLQTVNIDLPILTRCSLIIIPSDTIDNR